MCSYPHFADDLTLTKPETEKSGLESVIAAITHAAQTVTVIILAGIFLRSLVFLA